MAEDNRTLVENRAPINDHCVTLARRLQQQ